MLIETNDGQTKAMGNGNVHGGPKTRTSDLLSGFSLALILGIGTFIYTIVRDTRIDVDKQIDTAHKETIRQLEKIHSNIDRRLNEIRFDFETQINLIDQKINQHSNDYGHPSVAKAVRLKVNCFSHCVIGCILTVIPV
jgi:ribosomal protein S13